MTNQDLIDLGVMSLLISTVTESVIASGMILAGCPESSVGQELNRVITSHLIDLFGFTEEELIKETEHFEKLYKWLHNQLGGAN